MTSPQDNPTKVPSEEEKLFEEPQELTIFREELQIRVALRLDKITGKLWQEAKNKKDPREWVIKNYPEKLL